jgi:hypothetical protein
MTYKTPSTPETAKPVVVVDPASGNPVAPATLQLQYAALQLQMFAMQIDDSTIPAPAGDGKADTE